MAIIFTGMIGSGKSTLSQIAKEVYNTKVFEEPVEGNSILPLYYEDPKRYSFTLQMFFMSDRFESLINSTKYDIMDRHIVENLLFSEANYKKENMNKEEFDTFKVMYNSLWNAINKVHIRDEDTIFYLKASYETIMSNIKKRGRDYEQVDLDINYDKESYYRELISLYDEYFSIPGNADVILNMDELDVEKPNGREAFTKILMESVG